MSLPFRKELEKYKNINEDEILSKLSEDELKQLEHVLDDLDPEVGNRDRDKADVSKCSRSLIFAYIPDTWERRCAHG